MTRTICVYSFLLLLSFLLPQPLLGQTAGTLTIMQHTKLTENHEGNIIIGADRVRLDCRGFTVSGTGSGNGILLSDRTGVTVKNCIVTDFNTGFFLDTSSSNTLTGNIAKITRGGGSGFFLNQSDGNTLIRNTANDNRFGFGVSGSSHTLTGNIANDNTGFLVTGNASMNTLEENEGFDNAGFDAEDLNPGANDWVDNDFGSCSGFSDPPCPQ